MRPPVDLLRLGIVLLIVGILLIAVVPVVLVDNPAEVAIESVKLAEMDSQTISLDGGTYQAWADGSFEDSTESVALAKVTGEPVWSGPMFETLERIHGLQKLGEFTVTTGDYNITSAIDTRVYITEPLDTGGLDIVILVGIAVVAVGLFLCLLNIIGRLGRRERAPPPCAAGHEMPDGTIESPPSEGNE
jgi:hypothetical protein